MRKAKLENLKVVKKSRNFLTLFVSQGLGWIG